MKHDTAMCTGVLGAFLALALGCDAVDRAVVAAPASEPASGEAVDPPEDPYPDCSADHSICDAGFGTNDGLPPGMCSACLCRVECSAGWHCAAADAKATPSCASGICVLNCAIDSDCPTGMACVEGPPAFGAPICMWVADVCDENNSP